MKIPPIRNKSSFSLAATAMAGLLLSTAPLHAQTTLFADNFDRADSDDLNAVATGKSGSLGALDWLEESAGGGGRTLSNELQLGETGAGGGWALAYLNHNFTDATITTAGNFSVSVDIVNDDTNGFTRYAGIAVGGSSTDYSGWSSNAPASEGADFYIGYDGSGTEEFRIWENGALTTTTNLTFANPDTLRVDFTNVTNFNAGTTINYEVFNNGTSIASGDFDWGGTNENYLGLFSNWTSGGAEMDNFAVTVSSGEDNTAPTLSSTNPDDDATAVPASNNLVATFSEPIALGATGTVTIKNLSNPADTVITLPGPDTDGTLTVSGTSLTIDPAVDLVAGDEYAIEISATAVEDLAGNTYTGILATDVPNWSFITLPADNTPPILIDTDPADDASEVVISTNLVATFDEDIALGTTGTVTIKNLTNPADIVISLPGPDADGTLSASGSELIIDPAVDLAAGDQYSVEVSAPAVEDLSGNPYVGLLDSNDPNWRFTTDGTPPTSSSMGPMAGATDASISDSLTLTLGEDVQVGTGFFTIHLASDDSVVEAIDVTSGNVTIIGGEVTIDPTADFANSTDYYVTITAGAFTDLSGNPYAGFTDSSIWTFTTEAVDPTILFADNFNRADNNDLNADTTGKSGSLGTLDWLEKSAGGGGRTLSNELQLGEDGAGGGWALAYLDHNFIDATITGGGGFSVSIDIVNDDTAGGTRYAGIVVGGSLIDYSGWSSNAPASEAADFYVGYDGSGTEQFRIWENGVLTTTTNLTFANPDTLRVDFTNVTDFNAGTTINYEVFNNGSSVASGDFTWGGTNENYLGLFSNWTNGGAELDNFKVRANGVADPLVLTIAQSGGNLDFEWNSLSGMQYDLVSTTDPEAEPDPSMWAPYNDGSTTYENILSTGTGTQTLGGVINSGSPRLFTLIQEPVTPLFSESFEDDDGGFTTAKTTGTDWAHGDPDSVGFGGQTVSAGNGGSNGCWGTNIANPGYYLDPTTDSCLRSVVIDLTGVAGAELTFAQAIDLDSTDSVTVNIIDDINDTEIATDIFNITDGDSSSADWEAVGPITIPTAALGQPVRIEWCLSGVGGASDDFMGWYIDDVVVTPTTP